MKELYPYQQDAVERLKNGSILCGGVGSGKSRTALAYFYYIETKKLAEKKKLYIITTARKRDTKEWDEECSVFPLSEVEIVVDSWNNIQKYKMATDSFFIFDEQKVMGKGKWVKTFITITKSNHWILLTATPGDNWSAYIPVFIANGYFRNRTEFIEKHVVYNPYTKYHQVQRYVGQGKLIRYRNEILVKMNYSPEAELIRHVEIVDYDKTLYKSVIANKWNIYEDKPCVNSAEFFFVLRRIVNSDESRIQRLLDILKEHPKCIVFYNFDYELEILRAIDYPKGTIVKEYNGHVHQQVPKGEEWVYLVQYTAGSEAWNCITTDTMVLYSQNYSYWTLQQSMGRINRRNTPYKELHYYFFRSTSSLDTKIHYALMHKKDFNERAFNP